MIGTECPPAVRFINVTIVFTDHPHLVDLRDFLYRTLEWHLLYEQFGALMIWADLSESHYARTKAVRFFERVCSMHRSSHGGELFARGFPCYLLRVDEFRDSLHE
jgi:hypothetical protein